MNKAYRHIEVTPLGPALGAEIGGVDIARGVSEDQFDEIWQAFIAHSVVFFRDQDITPEQHVAFAEHWGEINVNRFFRPSDVNPKIAEVLKEPHQKNNIGSNWHTDHSYDQVPAMCSVLYAREVPPVGGDTLFASTCAAYEALSDGMQQMLRSMCAEHTSRFAFGEDYHAVADQADLDGRYANPELATQDAVHPVIIRHPLSGRPSIYVNGDFTVRFEGWTAEESRPLLDFLYAHITRPEFCYRFRWHPGSIAVWDNRATHHNAINDYHGHRRLMHRITIDGVALEAA